MILLDWAGLDFEVGSSPVPCAGLGAPGAPMQIQFSKGSRSIAHFAKRVAARFNAESILVHAVAVPMHLASITLVTASHPEWYCPHPETLLLDGLKVLITHSNFRSLPAVPSPL
jgi:hypothetical protein